MADQALYHHQPGTPWTDAEIEQLVKDLSAAHEIDAIDAIIWLRSELARIRNSPMQTRSKKKPADA